MSADPPPPERVLWRGSPVRCPWFDVKDRFLVPFGIIGLAVLGIIEYRAQSGGFSVFGVVAVVPFLVWFLYVLVGRLIVRHVMLRTIVYTVTDKRIIMRWRGFGRTHERSRYMLNLEPAMVGEYHAGVGTIRFGYARAQDASWQQRRAAAIGVNPYTGQDPWFVLRMIQNAATVRDIIERARRVADR